MWCVDATFSFFLFFLAIFLGKKKKGKKKKGEGKGQPSRKSEFVFNIEKCHLSVLEMLIQSL